MNYREQTEVIKNIPIHTGQSIRMDCPFCFHNNTLQLTKESGQMKWYCFSASCNAKGVLDTEKTMEDITYMVNKKKEDKVNWVVPDYFQPGHSTHRVAKYLNENNCIDAYNKGMANIQYDPQAHRAVFLIKDDSHKIIGGVGRAMRADIVPKWYVYGRKDYPYICGEGDVAVVVEDCASACAVSSNFAGVALMGTSLSDSFIPVIQKKFKEVIVALDRDATTKSYDIAKSLESAKVKTRVAILKDDLKYYRPAMIKEILCKNDN
tara:strand:+ start:155 stop:946 length:792 start_codon:yes stop_codon:yes gene_type:complete